MLIPLNQFICDTCQQLVKSPEQGWMEWISLTNSSTRARETHSFRIVHQIVYSPLSKQSPINGCYQHGKMAGRSDTSLDFVMKDAIRYMLIFLDPGIYHMRTYRGCEVTDMRNYVETVRRLTIPHYEEARQFWPKAISDGEFGDENELGIFNPEKLKNLIKKYKS